MRVVGTILPTNVFGDFQSPLGFERVRSSTFLGYQIDEIRALKKDPIVIIGPDGDDFLRATKSLVDRKMVFSKTTPEKMLEQVCIGLQGAGTCAFFLPLNVPVPAPHVWQELETALAKMDYGGGPHVLRPSFQSKSGWPILITAKGKEWLEELSEEILNSFDFFNLPDLQVQSVPVNSETVLQELRTTDDFQEWKSLYTA
jgi:hypothetical protein